VSPGHFFNSKGVDTKSEACHVANIVTRKIKNYVSEKDVWRMCDRGLSSREGTPLMISGAFVVALLWMHIRIRCPIIQVSLPEVHNKTRSMGSHFSSLFLNL